MLAAVACLMIACARAALRRPIRPSPSPSSCRRRRAASPTRSAASWRSASPRRGASRRSSRTSRAPTTRSPPNTSRRRPDGHTLFIGPEVTFVVNPSLYAKLSYDPVKDFVPITGLVTINHALIVNPSLPVDNVQGPDRARQGEAGRRSTTARSGSAHRATSTWSCCRRCRARSSRPCTTRARRPRSPT